MYMNRVQGQGIVQDCLFRNNYAGKSPPTGNYNEFNGAPVVQQL